MARSLSDWLLWQESLNPAEIELGLARVRDVASRLSLRPPPGRVFTVAGTNGKGSTVEYLAALLGDGGYRVGLYTSPHLVRYNERIRIDGAPVEDAALIDAFERVDAARGAAPLTFFEFGTLAALVRFADEGCDAWVLEVGLGGRLDAVNIIDPDFSLITTIGLDHQAWLGDTLDQIATEKAGIMRRGVPAFIGDPEAPKALDEHAAAVGATLRVQGRDFGFERAVDTWSWHGESVTFAALPIPPGTDVADLRNLSLAMATLEAFDAGLVTDGAVNAALARGRPPGRFEVTDTDPQWVLDVAHNEQAAAVLRRRLDALADPRATTAVVGMLADKAVEAFARELAEHVGRWVVVSLGGARGATAADVGRRIEAVVGRPVSVAEDLDAALRDARRRTPDGGRILCCGSFQIVGPALEWLGLYS